MFSHYRNPSMSSPTEVIIYRNPLEYQLYNSGILFPIMCAVP